MTHVRYASLNSCGKVDMKRHFDVFIRKLNEAGKCVCPFCGMELVCSRVNVKPKDFIRDSNA